MSDKDWPEPRVTDNAVLLAGYLAAAITSRDPMYRIVDAKPEEATTIFQHKITGNRFVCIIMQSGGRE